MCHNNSNYIVYVSHCSGVEESVEHFPNFINLKDHEGKTPLHIAIVNNHFHLATYLMEKVILPWL